jgi:AAA domain
LTSSLPSWDDGLLLRRITAIERSAVSLRQFCIRRRTRTSACSASGRHDCRRVALIFMRIHITGASGSGTSTLGTALAAELDYACIDADDYYWLPTTPPFTQKRPPDERLRRVHADLSAHANTVLAGSIVGWGATLEDSFDLIVFLYLDTETRVARLRAREIERLGHADPAFLTWAEQYDDGPPEGRSLAKHRAWLLARAGVVVEIHGDRSVEERVRTVVACINRIRASA